MKKFSVLAILLSSLFLSLPAQALMTELGLSYARKTTSFDSDNSYDSESITGSVSLYFWERVALELSYTDAKAVRYEKASLSDPKRTTTQQSSIMGADLILMFADRKSLFQPYIKGGAAQINRIQHVKIEGQSTYTIEPDTAVIPSYGAGLKIQLTETLGLKLSYEVWRTPIGSGLHTDDSQIKGGLTWYL